MGAHELRFEVDSMHCDGCRSAITGQIERIEGISDVDVNLDSQLVTVRGEELAEQVVREAIALAGYSSRLL